MDQQHKERMRINAVVKELELEMAEQDYQNEKRNAAKEFEEKKVKTKTFNFHLIQNWLQVYLKEQLIVQLEDKQRMIENERTSMELTGDSMELKPVITRKLRRRANEPTNGNGYSRYKIILIIMRLTTYYINLQCQIWTWGEKTQAPTRRFEQLDGWRSPIGG